MWVAAGVIVAVVALIVSAVALWYSRRTDDRDVILRLFDRMAETHEARRNLYAQAERRREWWNDAAGDSQRSEINGALALLEVIAYYVDRGFVEKAAILGMWSGMIAHTYESGRPYINWRRQTEPELWPNLDRLYEQIPMDIRRHYANLVSERAPSS